MSSAPLEAQVPGRDAAASSAPRILVLAGAPPGSGNVGEILLRDMCAYYPPGRIACAAVPPHGYVEMNDPLLDGVPVKKFGRPDERGIRLLPGRWGSLTSAVGFRLVFGRQAAILARSVVDFGRAHNVDKLCAVLDCPSTISIALKVAEQLRCPLVSLVWDSPTYLFRDFGLDRISLAKVNEQFARVLGHSECVAVMSEQMGDEYRRRWGVRTVLVRHGLAPGHRRGGAVAPSDARRFVIGFAGTLYAASAWEALLRALDGRTWTIDGRSVIIRLVGNDFRLRHRGPAHIEYLGFRTAEETAAILSGCDANYLPYPFEAHLRDLARLSFPSKFAAYAAAGRPVFVHAPEGSSLHEFMKSHPVGTVSASLQPSDIIGSLEPLATGGEAYRRMAVAMEQTARTEFTLESYLTAWATVFGVPPIQLLERLDRLTQLRGSESASLTEGAGDTGRG